MAVNKDTRKIKEAGEYTTSPARRKANNKFAKQNYETVGYKCKKGIKSIWAMNALKRLVDRQGYHAII